MTDDSHPFGTASLGTPATRTFTAAPTYDCGRLGKLTVSQIAKLSGVSPQGVRLRLRRGITGEALALPRWQSRKGATNKTSLVTAFRLARAFPDVLPSVAEIRKAVPMQPSKAYQRRAIMRQAMEALDG